MKKLIINFTPTGMIPTKAMTPHVPVTPAEIIRDVLTAADLGASMIHLHARDEAGIPAYQKEIYAEIIAGIRAQRPELILIVSTSGRNFPEYAKREQVLELDGPLKPDMASLTLSSLNFNQMASVNSPETIIKLAEKMAKTGIKPELEIFDLGMVNYAHYLIRKGLITPPYFFNIILGNIAAAQAKLMHLGLIVAELPEQSIWSVGGVGDFQLQANALGIVMGDGVRVGLEDNIWLDENRTILAENRQLIERVVKIAAVYGRNPAPPAEVRSLLGL